MAHYQNLHSWDLNAKDAVALQKELASQIVVEKPTRKIETIAGADISFNKYSDVVSAAIIVLRLDTLETIAKSGVVTTAKFPYIPGLLSFREMPALIEAWEKLDIEPDAIVMDGHGLAHPRGMGIACHAGLVFDRPALGCGKSVLVGKFEPPAETRGSWSPMIYKERTIGAALRTKNRVSPVFVSPGHKMDLPTAIDLMLRCDGGYRLPEPTRRTHLYVNEIRLENMENSE